MFIQETLPNYKHTNSSNVDTMPNPSPAFTLATPKPFYVEYGRNKPLPNGKNLFIRNEYKEVNWLNYKQTCNKYINDYTENGWGLYMTAFQYSTPDPYEAEIRGDFFLDFDDEDNIRNAQEDALHIIQHLIHSPKYKIPSNMIKVFFSGKKGIHVTIPYQCFGVEWHPHLDKIYKIMAEELKPFTPNHTLDMQVYERRRLFRLQGSKHPATGSYKVPMELKHLLVLTEKDIQQLSQRPSYGSWIKYERPRVITQAAQYFKEVEGKFAQRFKKMLSNSSESQSLDFDPPCYAGMLEDGPTRGSRNHVASMLVAFWRQRGVSEQEAWDMLVDWNDGSLPERELQTLFRSNFKGRYVYGCNTIKQYATCPATCRRDCKFYKST